MPPITGSFGALTARGFGLFSAPAALVGDEYFEYVTMLLPGNGTNGGQNNTFLDSSTNNFTITRNGNTTQGTFSPYGDNWSNYFDGSGDYLTAGSASDWTFLHNGAQDYTIEAFVYLTATPASQSHIVSTNSASASAGYRLYIDSSLNINSAYTRGVTGSTLSVTSSSAITLNQWYYIAVTFTDSTNTCAIYINGVSSNSGVISAFSASAPPNTLNIGRNPSDGAGLVTGYISNLRISDSVRSVSSTPTAPYTSDANTELLTCQSNRFIDNSTNAFTITVNGNTSVQRFSPFSPTAAYSSSTIGGSGYFDGSGDYLVLNNSTNTAGNFGTEDFTVEMWVYPTSTSSYSFLIDARGASTGGTGYWLIDYDTSGIIHWANDSVVITAGSALTLNSWSHIAVSRSGTSTKMFINGTQTGLTYSDSTNYLCGNNRPAIAGSGFSAGSSLFNGGYISNLRVVKGTAVYTSAFTPPTAPVTAISGTSLLTNFTNASIIDNAMMNDLETVGNAQISTTIKKYGTGSLAFDGAGDFLFVSSSPNFALSGDFTIECWAYPNSQSKRFPAIVFFNTPNIAIQYDHEDAANKFSFLIGGTRIAPSSTQSTGAWYHVAAVRSGSTVILYINGTSVATTTNSTAFGSTALAVGGYDPISVERAFNGYIDDLRITKGIARYTSNFTPPTAALPTF